MSFDDHTLRPLCAFDIWDNGTAKACADVDLTPTEGASYRWLHLDLADGGLPSWAARHLPPLARRTLLADKTRPRMDSEDGGLSVTLRGVNLNDGEETADMVSLRIWVSDALIVTVRRQRVFAVEDLRARVEAGDAPHSPGHMLARITEGLVGRLEQIAFDREDLADDMEDAVYDEEKPLPTDLAPLRREIIKLRRHVAPLSEALLQLAQSDTGLIRDDLRARMRDTASRCKWALEEMLEIHERLETMADHLEAVADARLERNSWRLSVVAAIFLPISFLTGLFGVNVGGMPGVDDPMAFAWLCIGMGIVAFGSFLIMRLLRWF